jgi:hypothetical protein
LYYLRQLSSSQYWTEIFFVGIYNLWGAFAKRIWTAERHDKWKDTFVALLRSRTTTTVLVSAVVIVFLLTVKAVVSDYALALPALVVSLTYLVARAIKRFGLGDSFEEGDRVQVNDHLHGNQKRALSWWSGTITQSYPNELKVEALGGIYTFDRIRKSETGNVYTWAQAAAPSPTNLLKHLPAAGVSACLLQYESIKPCIESLSACLFLGTVFMGFCFFAFCSSTTVRNATADAASATTPGSQSWGVSLVVVLAFMASSVYPGIILVAVIRREGSGTDVEKDLGRTWRTYFIAFSIVLLTSFCWRLLMVPLLLPLVWGVLLLAQLWFGFVGLLGTVCTLADPYERTKKSPIFAAHLAHFLHVAYKVGERMVRLGIWNGISAPTTQEAGELAHVDWWWALSPIMLCLLCVLFCMLRKWELNRERTSDPKRSTAADRFRGGGGGRGGTAKKVRKR